MSDAVFPSALPPGTVVGQYKLLKAVGQGGFGITYAAWDKKLNRQVAVKECVLQGLCYRNAETGQLVAISEAAEGLYRHALLDMHREVRTLAALNHVRIVPVYDVFRSQGGLFYAMPWLEGGSLKERMEDARRHDKPVADIQTVCRWMQQLLEGLEYLHAKGIIHRDIKPDNILFNEQDEPVIIDFGAALNRPERTTSTSQGEFSVAYGAPEQITGKGRIGPWTDFYSLAAVFYELVCGTRAESADKRLMDESLLAPEGFPGTEDYPAPMLAAITRNLSLEPTKRCQSATEWRRLLDPSSLTGSRRMSSKTLWWLLALAAALLVGLGVLGYGAFSGGGTEDAPAVHKTSTPAELERSVRAYLHIDEWERDCQAFQGEWDAFCQEMVADYQSVVDEINKEPNPHERDFKAMRREQSMTGKWAPRLQAFGERYQKIAEALPNADAMMQQYPTKSDTETALLPSVCQRIYLHCTELGEKANPKNYRRPVLQYMVDTEVARQMKSFNER